MKINYDFYSGKDEYSDGDIENEIIEYEKNFKNADEVFKNDIRWPVFYHLTPLRGNILNWYPFKEDAEVLEIGAGMGAITETLCQKCKNVVSVELSKNRASSIAQRNQDKENLEIIVGNLNDIDFGDRKFDYITLIGVFEYATLYTNTENPFNDFLNNIKKYLKEDGKLLIAIENQFGMKYFLGAPEDHTNIKYDGITGYKNGRKTARTFGKSEIKKILAKSDFNFTKFYYPLPDYKLPQIIFSDEYLPTEETIENYIPYYYEQTEIEFDEKEAYKEVIKNNMFDFFANSFMIECSQNEINTKVELEKIDMIKITEIEQKFYNKDYSKKENKELEELRAENKNLRTELEGIKDSRSWKIINKFRK
jgi:SAM-dependent methyltransferase